MICWLKSYSVSIQFKASLLRSSSFRTDSSDSIVIMYLVVRTLLENESYSAVFLVVCCCLSLLIITTKKIYGNSFIFPSRHFRTLTALRSTMPVVDSVSKFSCCLPGLRTQPCLRFYDTLVYVFSFLQTIRNTLD